MDSDAQELARLFRDLNDAELIDRCATGNLSVPAQRIADAELASRGLHLPGSEAAVDSGGEAAEFVTIARYINPTDAHIVRACLEAAGIPALAADADFTRMFSPLATAAGGVRIRVPAGRMAEAMEIIRAFNRGELALKDDEPGEVWGG